MGFQAERALWDCGCDDPGLAGGLIGAYVGSAALTPVFVHIANDRRGSLGGEYVAAALIAGAGIASLTGGGNTSRLVWFIATPIAQVVSAVLIERKTSRPKP